MFWYFYLNVQICTSILFVEQRTKGFCTILCKPRELYLPHVPGKWIVNQKFLTFTVVLGNMQGLLRERGWILEAMQLHLLLRGVLGTRCSPTHCAGVLQAGPSGDLLLKTDKLKARQMHALPVSTAWWMSQLGSTQLNVPISQRLGEKSLRRVRLLKTLIILCLGSCCAPSYSPENPLSISRWEKWKPSKSWGVELCSY